MNLQLALWLPYWRMLMRYHRYQVLNLERLDGPQPMLIAGYHGRGLAYDMCMINIAIYDRLHYMPHSMLHRGIVYVPWWRWLADGLGFFIGDGPELAAAVRRGEHLIVTPGGAAEGCRRWDDTYRVSWSDHLGYVKLAVRYGLPIVPVGCAGADGTYIGLNSGPEFGEWLGLPKDYAYLAWTGLGPLGLYPFSPAFPVRMLQIVGEPIDPREEGATSSRDTEALLRVHRRVTAAVQDLIDDARERVRRGVTHEREPLGDRARSVGRDRRGHRAGPGA